MKQFPALRTFTCALRAMLGVELARRAYNAWLVAELTGRDPFLQVEPNAARRRGRASCGRGTQGMPVSGDARVRAAARLNHVGWAAHRILGVL